MVRFRFMQQLTLKLYSMKVKFFSCGEMFIERMEREMNMFLSSKVVEVVDKKVFFEDKCWNIAIFYIEK